MPGPINNPQPKKPMVEPKQQQPARRGDPRRHEDTTRLVSLGAAFLTDAVPQSNIIFERDFARFAPLFNRAQMSQLTRDQQLALASAYRDRFSLQHPVKVISEEYQEAAQGGIYYPGDKDYHKLVALFPPVFMPLKTLNEAGNNKLSLLIDCLFNSASKDDPTSKLKSMVYTDQIGKVMGAINTPEEKERYMQQFREAEDRLLAQRNAELNPEEAPSETGDNKKQDASSSMSTVEIDW